MLKSCTNSLVRIVYFCVNAEIAALREAVDEFKKDKKKVADQLEEIKDRLEAKELGQKDLLTVISDWALEQDNTGSKKEPDDESDKDQE